MSDIGISFAVLGAVVVLFVWNRLPVGIVALGAALTLYGTGVLELEQALAGFGDPTVLLIASLFVVGEGLEATGVTAWIGQQLVDRAGGDRRRLVVLMMLLVAGLTAVVNPNASVAALFPVVLVAAIRLGATPSRLLIPLAFGAHAGSMLALTGSPVNVLSSQYAIDAGLGRFAFFEFTLVGVPLMLGAIVIVMMLGERLLPERTPRSMPADFSAHTRTLLQQYGLREGEPLYTVERGVAEIVVPPRSPLIGMEVFPGMITPSGDLMILSVQRRGEDLGVETVTLEPGDTLLLRGSWAALDEHLTSPEVLVVDDPDAVRRQVVPLGFRAKETLVVLVAMVVMLATGLVPAVVAGLLGAGALVILRVLTPEQAYRSIAWTTVVLVAGMIPLSTAMVQTGAAERIADVLVGAVGDAGPYALLTGLFLLTVALGQLISNMATALIVIPIGLSAAADVGVSARPALMAVTVAAAASFLTPVATPANMMVMGPGGYRFGDYWKLGLPMVGLFFLVAVFLVPVFWSF